MSSMYDYNTMVYYLDQCCPILAMGTQTIISALHYHLI